MSNPKMPDMNALMRQAQKLQADVAKVQEECANMECEGAAGGGLVTVTLKGSFEVVESRSTSRSSIRTTSACSRTS